MTEQQLNDAFEAEGFSIRLDTEARPNMEYWEKELIDDPGYVVRVSSGYRLPEDEKSMSIGLYTTGDCYVAFNHGSFAECMQWYKGTAREIINQLK